jgi:hypothetical protein
MKVHAGVDYEGINWEKQMENRISSIRSSLKAIPFYL